MNTPDLKQPDYPKQNYAQICYGKYSQLNDLKSIRVRFWRSRSKNYRKAKFLASLLPNYVVPNAKNNFWAEFTIDNGLDFYVYYQVLYELHMIIFSWKYVEHYVNSEICYSDEYWIYINQMAKIIYYPKVEQIAINAKIKEFSDKWKNEKELFSIISNNFNTYTVERHYRDSWLENLELDIYIPELKIGIEYQGIQHFKPMKHWGGEDGFVKRRTNDIRKKELCEQNGVRLIYFYYYEKVTNELVIERLLPYIN